MADADRTLFGRAMAAAGSLPDLMVAADRVASTVIQGVHGRRRVGQGDSFWQFRRYQPGDSTQRIDWRQSAKNRAVFIRETEWEAAASVWLWRDASPSMRYASTEQLPQKAERADLVLLALASLLVGGGERIALLGDGRRPATGRTVLRRFAENLMLERQADGARFASQPPQVPLPAWGNVVLIGDFLDPIEEIEALVRFYAGRGVLGHIVQVLDPAEVTLAFGGHVKLSGLVNEGTHPIRLVEAVRADYHQRLLAQQEGLARIARSVGWTLHLHRTDKPPQTLLLSLYMAMSEPRRGSARRSG
jgi:uncharacterized protein (DUF58 family)